MTLPQRRLLAIALCMLSGILAPGAAAGTLVPPSPELADLAAFEHRIREAVDLALPCTVALRVRSNSGSGVIVSPDGLILTAAHVVGAANQSATVTLSDGRILEAVTLGADHSSDSGMLRLVDPGPFPYAPLGDLQVVDVGSWCITVGHPGGYERGRGPVVRLGRILGKDSRFLQTDCPILQGDSGGPLLALDGTVIGIHSRLQWRLTSNFHVPITMFRRNWDRLASGTPQPMLGIEGRTDERGCRVVSLLPGMSAERAGIETDDLIVAFNGNRVDGIESLVELIGQQGVGDEVSLEVQRGSTRMTVQATLDSRQ